MPNDHDEQPPDMGEPPDQQQAVPPPPRGAPLHLAMVLSTVRDPAQRQLLLDTYAEMGPGLSQELFGQVGAYLSAILDHQTSRGAAQAEQLTNLAGIIQQTLQEYGEALALREQAGGTQALSEEQVKAGFGAHFGQWDAMRKIVASEVDRAVAAASNANARVLKIACACCFLAGIIAAALFVHWF